MPVTTNIFRAPTTIASARDGSDRLFIVEQAGLVRVIQGGLVLPEFYLNLTNQVLSGGERGLLGMAFAPGFPTNGHLYFYYTRKPDGATVLARFTQGTNVGSLDTNSQEVLKVTSRPFGNHNGGQLAFGPDGFLYIGMGDGGYLSTPDPFTNGQNRATVLGKMLRIDVESGVFPYAIPTNNPFVSNTNYAPEIWATGLRNPWRFSFDRSNGDLFIADVGQNRFEEINVQPAGSAGGENYGWPFREGFFSFQQPRGDTNAFDLPAFAYVHPESISITGGYVYRGPGEPRMQGIYFFGDFVLGKIWGAKKAGTNWLRLELIDTTNQVSTFGEDDQGRLYLASFNAGRIYQLVDSRAALTPSISPAGGTFTNDQMVLANTATPGARIHFTRDGSVPTELDPSVLPGESILVSGSQTLKLCTIRNDLLPSEVRTGNFSFVTASPFFTPAQGSITNGTLMDIRSGTVGATIFYTVDGSVPGTNSLLYQTPFAMNGNSTLRAMAFKSGYTPSGIVTTFYSLPTISPLQFNPYGATISNGTPVMVSTVTPGVAIYYTLDGSDPTESSSTYTGPVQVNGGQTLRARAFRVDMNPSAIQSAYYAWAQVDWPEFTPRGGLFTNGTQVIISTLTPGATIHYTRDGSEPNETSPIYSNGLLTVTSNAGFRALALKAGFRGSGIGEAQFDLLSPEETMVSTWAGNGAAGWRDGPGSEAEFNFPHGICIDPSGNLYVTDLRNHAIRKIGTNGMVTTIAGNGFPGYVNGTGTNAQFNQPTGIAFGPSGDLFVADSGNWRVRRVTLAGQVSLFTGNGLYGTYNGTPEFAGFIGMSHMTTDRTGNIYLGSGGLRKIEPNGNVSTIHVSYANSGWFPSVAFQDETNLMVVGSSVLIQLRPGLGEEIFAGRRQPGMSDGPRFDAEFLSYRALISGAARDFYMGDASRIRHISDQGMVTTLAGSLAGYENGRGVEAKFNEVAGLVMDSNGNIYVADGGNHRIRKIIWDRDHDLIPDFQETGTNGLLVGVDDRIVDSDNDGMSNIAEYWAGTDPTNFDSALRVESISVLSDGKAQIKWLSVAGKTYQVQFSLDLRRWHSLGAPVVGTGNVISISDPNSSNTSGKKAYRVYLTE